MKKNSFQLLLLSILFPAAFYSCDKDERDINLNLTEVNNLFTPANNVYVKLQPHLGGSVNFEWEEAKAEDGSIVFYEVAFDQENGDFSKPFYKVVSENKGLLNKLSISHGDLSKIAQLGGAAFFQRKKFRWTVLASKGTNVKKAGLSAIIDLERPGGFDVLPGDLYLTGTATENGGTLGDALRMKRLAPGEFEIYSKLKAGNYKFVDAITGTPKEYYLFDDSGAKILGINGQSEFTGPDKIMRIRLNFNNVNGSLVEVKEVGLWYSAGNTIWFTMPYTSNGVWKKTGYTVTYTSMPWGLDERYKYRMVINDGTGDQNVWLNYTGNDSPGQDGKWPHTTEYKVLNLATNNSSQWDWTWKFDRNYLTQGAVADFTVSLRGSEATYSQEYKKP